MKLKIIKLVSIVIAFLLAFPLHFLYDKFPNFIISIIAPVNESIAEHMKILFTSIIITGIIQKIYIKIKKLDYNNVCISNFIAALSSIPIFLILFLPIYYSIGENFIVTIIIMFIAIATSQIISYLIIKKDDLKLENTTIFLVLVVYIVFGILTYFTPQTNLFIDPKTLTYGIKR